MKAIRSILVVVDRTWTAADAVAKALRLATHNHARIKLFLCDAEQAFHMSRAYDMRGVDSARQACVSSALNYLQSLKERAGGGQVPMELQAVCESPLYESIVRTAREGAFDLVIKNATGATLDPSSHLDATDWQLMRACPATLILTRGRPWGTCPRFGAAVDITANETVGLARDIVQAGEAMICDTDGSLEVIYCEPTSSEPQAREARAVVAEMLLDSPAGGHDVHVLAGRPEATLPTFAASRDYDALLLGALTHRPGLTHQVGTLTSRLADALPCDLVLVKSASSTSSLVAPSFNQAKASEYLAH